MEKHHHVETEIPISREEGMPGVCRADGGKWLQEEVPRALGLEMEFQKECKQVGISDRLAFLRRKGLNWSGFFPLITDFRQIFQEHLAHLLTTTRTRNSCV